MKNDMVIYSRAIAQELLKLGYSITGVKPNRKSKDFKDTVFFFENEKGIENALKNIINSNQIK